MFGRVPSPPPPPPPWPSMPFFQQVRFTHSHNISKWHPGSRGRTGSAKQKWFVTLISSFTVCKKKLLDYLRSISCINVCIRGYNCCQTSIELSKCIYLASIGVKIQLAVKIKTFFFFFLQNAYLMVMPTETWPTKLRCIPLWGITMS